MLRTLSAIQKHWTRKQIVPNTLPRRSVLTLAGLKRGEIGEIASKIGQLYYNFYLRNAETRYLLESYTFYQAIHSR